jgi:cobalt-precorrin 5A hydrolase
MKVAVFAYSRQGCKTARKVMGYFSGDEVRAYTMERFEEPDFGAIERPSKPFYEPIFAWSDAMVFVGAVGIAVREIAPFIRSKLTDPAVVSMDELGHYVIPLLSGHIGGANDLALSLAEVVEGTPVVTTATDINKKFSVDAWAARKGLAITNLSIAKSVSAEILERPVPVKSDFPVVTELPNGVVAAEEGKIGIYISCSKEKPFEETLLLVPPVLHLGIGCRRGTPVEKFREAVDSVLKEYNIHPKAIKQVTSIDIKSNEEGLLEFCKERNLPAVFYTAEQLWEVPGEFTPSQCVLRFTGVDNVCERSSMIGAEKLLVKKTIRNGVTVAIAAEAWEVSF